MVGTFLLDCVSFRTIIQRKAGNIRQRKRSKLHIFKVGYFGDNLLAIMSSTDIFQTQLSQIMGLLVESTVSEMGRLLDVCAAVLENKDNRFLKREMERVNITNKVSEKCTIKPIICDQTVEMDRRLIFIYICHTRVCDCMGSAIEAEATTHRKPHAVPLHGGILKCRCPC